MKTSDYTLAVTTMLVWGLGFPFAKAGMAQFPSILLMAMRFTVAALVLVWFVRPPWAYLWRIFGIVVVGGTIPYSLIFSGLGHLDASTTALVVQLQVPFLAFFGWLLLKEKFGWSRFVGLVMAFVGVAMISGQPAMRPDLLYLGMVVVGGAFWAMGQTLIRIVAPRVGGLQLIAWVAVLVAPQLLISSLIFEDGQWQAIRTAGWGDWGAVAYLGFVMTAFGYTLWYKLLSRCEVNQVGPFLLLQPAIAVLGGMLMLAEAPSWVTLAGGGVIIAGVAMTTRQRATAG